jgi:hypothetical protein
MKKIGIVLVFSILCVRTFAFDYLGSDKVDDLDLYESYYEFFSVDHNNPADILSLGMLIAREGSISTEAKIDFVWGVTALVSVRPIRIIENNTNLRQVVKDKMKQKGANVSVAVDGSSCLYVNILMPDGKYTTIVYF